MKLKDQVGLSLSGATPESRDHYHRALRELQCYIDDPVASVDAALEESPGFTMAHVLKAYLHLLGTEPDGIPVARACLAACADLEADGRERGHLEAATHLAAGRWHKAGRVLEDISAEHPADILALQAGHLVDFYTGNSRMLRDRMSRAMRRWSPDMPGYHALLGMYAFGLEETADYAGAERAGRQGVELEPRDGWAQHAVAHVMEMQCRPIEGIEWMRGNMENWSRDSFFQVHNWWHLALYHLELSETDEVLALFDGPIHGPRSTLILDMIDASALLWRLHLLDIDTSPRWQSVADGWMPLAEAANYAFNDVHAVMAFVGADRADAVQRALDAQQAAMMRDDDNAAFTREVGRPVALALAAFGEGRYGEAVELLRPVREIAHRFGGSHAQRDLLDQTLMEAARRAGQSAYAEALCSERLARRPDSPLSRLFAARAAEPRHAA
jgi:tetratricopeptide (TPR) repeat protein